MWRSKPQRNCTPWNSTSTGRGGISLEDGIKCLATHGLRRVVFVGDSVSAQLMYSISCADERHRLAHMMDTSNKSRLGKRQGFTYYTGEATKHDFLIQDSNFLLHVMSVRGMQLIYLWPRPRYSYRGLPYASSLQAAFQHTSARQLLLEPALWTINLGLWHLFPSGTRGEDRLKNYASELCMVLSVLNTHARGRLLWRDTTSVHNSSLRADASPLERAKFGVYFTPAAVAQLNRVALGVLGCFPRVELHDGFFAATKDRAADTLPGDTRHYGPRVLTELLRLSFTHWCSEPSAAVGKPVAHGCGHGCRKMEVTPTGRR